MANGTDDFLNLLRPHYQDALKYCHALCRNKDQAGDLFQQSALRAIESLEQLTGREKFKAWFFRIITNSFYLQARQPWWRVLVPLKEEDHDQDGQNSLFNEETTDDRCQLLYMALSRLKPKERAAILLFEAGSFSLEEIREIQGETSLSAIKSRLSRARQKLRQDILLLEKTNPETLLKGDVNHEAETLISRYK